MASSDANDGPAQSYPSPRPNPLPFYHQEPLSPTRNVKSDAEPQQDLRGPAGQDERGLQMEQSMLDNHTSRTHMSSVMGEGSSQEPYENMQSVFSLRSSPTAVAFQGSTSGVNAGDDLSTAPPSAGSLRQKDRTKVSRACDECRRKKIRCDAVDESATTPCFNCTRSGSNCAFTRQPMKRGPSKGYIKELANRLNSLEQQVQQPQSLQQIHSDILQLPQNSGEDISGGQNVTNPRVAEKRTRDMAEFPEEHSPRRGVPAPRVGATHSAQNYSASQQLQPSQGGITNGSVLPFWSRGPEHRREATGVAFEAESEPAITSFDWDEDVLAEYYRIIHQTFPLLPNNKTRLRQRLAECPSTLREAFLAALDCLTRTFPTTVLESNANYPQALKRAAELLAKYPFENPSSHSNATNLVYLQTLLLMALETDNHGPATIRGQAGPSRAEWLGRAAGVAGQLEINVISSSAQSIIAGDPDSEERLARRVWWVLFILDRWHASSTADLLKLPENSVVLLPEDQILLGESTYHLARLSFIIGHLAAILTTTKTPSTDVMARSNPASSLLVLTLAGEIDRFRESVESVWGSLNLVHLSYHHCHLLIKRLSPDCAPTELIGHAVKVATVLNSRLTPVTPLNHHFGALAAMTLCELCDVPQTRADALKGLDAMIDALGEGRGLAGKLNSDGWDGAVRELVKKKKERYSLPNGEPGPTDRGIFDPTMLTRYGYLTALGQGLFQAK